MNYRISLFVALACALLVPAPLLAQTAPETLTFSKPAIDSVHREPVEFIHVGFGTPVDLLTLEIVAPDGTVAMVYDAVNEPFQMGTAPQFSLGLPEPLTKSGQYYAKWRVSITRPDKTIDTADGQFGFVIDLPVSASEPEGSATPQPGASEK